MKTILKTLVAMAILTPMATAATPAEKINTFLLNSNSPLEHNIFLKSPSGFSAALVKGFRIKAGKKYVGSDNKKAILKMLKGVEGQYKFFDKITRIKDPMMFFGGAGDGYDRAMNVFRGSFQNVQTKATREFGINTGQGWGSTNIKLIKYFINLRGDNTIEGKAFKVESLLFLSRATYKNLDYSIEVPLKEATDKQFNFVVNTYYYNRGTLFNSFLNGAYLEYLKNDSHRKGTRFRKYERVLSYATGELLQDGIAGLRFKPTRSKCKNLLGIKYCGDYLGHNNDLAFIGSILKEDMRSADEAISRSENVRIFKFFLPALIKEAGITKEEMKAFPVVQFLLNKKIP